MPITEQELEVREKTLRELLEEVELPDEEDKEAEVEDKEELEEADAEEVEAEADEEEDDETNESVEHLKAIFKQAELSEEAQKRIATLFESAVAYEAQKRTDAIRYELEEAFNKRVHEKETELTDKADSYLTYVVEQWTAQNKPAYEQKVKIELMESFISGLRDLFLEHNFNIPEAKADLVDAMRLRVESLEETVSQVREKNENLKEQLDATKRAVVMAELTEGMTAMEKEKFRSFVEGKSYASAEELREGAVLIKESYFQEETEAETVVEQVNEDNTAAAWAAYLKRR